MIKRVFLMSAALFVALSTLADYVSKGDEARVRGMLEDSGFDTTGVRFVVKGAEPSFVSICFAPGMPEMDVIERYVAYGKTLGTLPVVKADGYDFKGWYTEPEGGRKISASTKATEDTEYYAQWTPHTYTVKFSANGGNGKMTDLTKLKYGEWYDLPPCTFTYNFHEFVGWALESGDSAEVVYGDEDIIESLTAKNGGTVTLHACWRRVELAEGTTISGSSENGKNTYFWQYGWHDRYGAWNGTMRLLRISGSPATLDLSSGIEGIPVGAVDASALSGNASLTSVTFPESVTEVQAGAFRGCRKLASVYFLGDEPWVIPEEPENADGFYAGAPNTLTSYALRDRSWEEWGIWENRRMVRISAMPDNFRDGVVLLRVADGEAHLGSVSGGNKRVKGGTKVTVKAAAKKGAAFRGWFEIREDGRYFVSDELAYSFTASGQDLMLEASFVENKDDWLQVDDDWATMSELGSPVGTVYLFNIYSGSRATVTVSGLPPGITALQVREDQEMSVACVGTPTKAGRYWVTCTAKNANGYAMSAVIRWEIGEVRETDYDNIGLEYMVGEEALRELDCLYVGEYYSHCSFDMKSVGGLPPGLKYEPGSLCENGACTCCFGFIYGTPTKAGKYTVTFTDRHGRKAVRTVVVRDAGSRWFSVTAGDGGSVTGAGVYSIGSTVKYTAKAASGYAFAGWYRDPGFGEPFEDGKSGDYRTASDSVMLTDGTGRLYARFVSRAEDSAISIRGAGDWDTRDDWDHFIYVESQSKPTVTVGRLPSGIKYDKTSGRFYIEDEAKLNSGVTEVSITAKNVSGTSVTETLRIRVPNLTSPYIHADDEYVYTVGESFCCFYCPIYAEDGWTLSADKLPPGITWDKAGGRIKSSSCPTKAGAYTVVLTAKRGRETAKATVTMTILPMPAEYIGTFNGFLLASGGYEVPAEEATYFDTAGTLSVTIGSTGKISASIMAEGKKSSFSGAGLTYHDDWEKGPVAEAWLSRAGSFGEESLRLVISRAADGDEWQLTGEFSSEAYGRCLDATVIAQRNPFGKVGSKYENPEAHAMAELLRSRGKMSVYVSQSEWNRYSLYGPECGLRQSSMPLSFTVKSDGTVSMSGSIAGLSVSGSTMLHVGRTPWKESIIDGPFADFYLYKNSESIRVHIEFNPEAAGCRHGEAQFGW